MLRAFVLTRDHDAGRDMGEAHGGIGFIDVLPAGAAGAIRVDAQIGFVNFDLDGVIDFRINEQRSKRSMTPRIGVKGGDSHQPVNACFRFQVAVGVIAFDVKVTLFKPASSPGWYSRISLR